MRADDQREGRSDPGGTGLGRVTVLGHQFGDEVLRGVSRRLDSVIDPGDFLAHLHGDEFALVSDAIRTDEDVRRVVDALTRAVEEPIDREGGAIRVSASIGYELMTDLGDMEAALRDADRRTAAAKQARRIASGRERRRS